MGDRTNSTTASIIFGINALGMHGFCQGQQVIQSGIDRFGYLDLLSKAIRCHRKGSNNGKNSKNIYRINGVAMVTSCVMVRVIEKEFRKSDDRFQHILEAGFNFRKTILHFQKPLAKRDDLRFHRFILNNDSMYQFRQRLKIRLPSFQIASFRQPPCAGRLLP